MCKNGSKQVLAGFWASSVKPNRTRAHFASISLHRRGALCRAWLYIPKTGPLIKICGNPTKNAVLFINIYERGAYETGNVCYGARFVQIGLAEPNGHFRSVLAVFVKKYELA